MVLKQQLLQVDFSQGGGVADSDGPIEPVYVGFGRNPNGFYLRESLIDEFGYWNQELIII